MFNFDLDKVEIFGIEFHSFCNLDCKFCPRYVMNNLPKERIWIKEEYVDFVIENIIKKAKNLKLIGLSGLNQTVITKDDVYYLNNFIKRCKEINSNFKFKICTNGTTTKQIDCIDIFELNFDMAHYTLHRKNDFWVEDLLEELEKRNLNYTIYINKKNNNIEIVEFNNKKITFKPDYSKLDKAELKDYKKIIKENNYGIINLENKYDFLEKITVPFYKDLCEHNQLRLDYRGYIVPCFSKHSLLGDNLEYGHLEFVNNEVKYIENNNIDNSWCDNCCMTTDGTIEKNYDNYIIINKE